MGLRAFIHSLEQHGCTTHSSAYVVQCLSHPDEGVVALFSCEENALELMWNKSLEEKLQLIFYECKVK